MIPTSVDAVRATLEPVLTDDGRTWLLDAVAEVGRDARAVRLRFPAAGRTIGSRDLGGWTAADGARILLLHALGAALAEELPELYRFGDTGERHGILAALNVLTVGGDALEFVRDALRSNDPRLVYVALGPFAQRHLNDGEIYNAVLKCIFMDIPLTSIDGLLERVTPELSRMVATFVRERVAAGRDVGADVWLVIDKYPPRAELDALEAERSSAVDDRRHAAERAFALRPSP